VDHEGDCQASMGTDNARHSAGLEQYEDQEAPPGIDHNISPGVSCPATVLVARMYDGGYLLMAYPQREPAAFVVQDDAGPLQQALAKAFENSKEEIVRGSENGKRTDTVVPGYEALHGEQIPSGSTTALPPHKPPPSRSTTDTTHNHPAQPHNTPTTSAGQQTARSTAVPTPHH
jgi:hypothetical protein